MYTYVIKDIYGNWFSSQWKYATEKAAEEDSLALIKYDFVDIIKVIKVSEIKNYKSFLN